MPISSERRHHGQRIALGFVVDDRDEIVAIGIFAFDVVQRRPDGAGKVAALDDVAGQAIALAAVEGELLAFGDGGLRAARGLREASTPIASASAAIRTGFVEG